MLGAAKSATLCCAWHVGRSDASSVAAIILSFWNGSKDSCGTLRREQSMVALGMRMHSAGRACAHALAVGSCAA
eukprot:SAG31_NODE_17754_length_659_cov_0.830357_1_plen_73_part_10